MGIAERREREKEALRTRMVEAARDIVSERGLDALSMRAIAERVEYSPATIYLYFRDKDELLREVVHAGFRRMGDYVRAEMQEVGPQAGPLERHRALGRAYARFALGNTAYFRVMFELPTVAQVSRPEDCQDPDPAAVDANAWATTVETVREGMEQGLIHAECAEEGAVIAWGLIHGLTSLYLSGHLAETVHSNEEFLALVERAMDALGGGWRRETGALPGA